MRNLKHTLALGLAAATVATCIVNALGNVAVTFKVGPTPVFSIVAMALAAGAFVVSWMQRSLLVSGLLSASGIIFMIPALNAMEYSFAVITFPGPILGVILGIVIFGIGVAKGIMAAKTLKAIPK